STPRGFGEEAQRGNAEVRRKENVVVVVHAELGDSIDVRRCQARVGDCVANRFDRQAHLTASRISRVFGVADSNYRALVLEGFHRALPLQARPWHRRPKAATEIPAIAESARSA